MKFKIHVNIFELKHYKNKNINGENQRFLALFHFFYYSNVFSPFYLMRIDARDMIASSLAFEKGNTTMTLRLVINCISKPLVP